MLRRKKILFLFIVALGSAIAVLVMANKSKLNAIARIEIVDDGGVIMRFERRDYPSIIKIDPYTQQHVPAAGPVFLAKIIGNNGVSVDGLISVAPDGGSYSFRKSQGLLEQISRADDLWSRVIVDGNEKASWSNFVNFGKMASSTNEPKSKSY